MVLHENITILRPFGLYYASARTDADVLAVPTRRSTSLTGAGIAALLPHASITMARKLCQDDVLDERSESADWDVHTMHWRDTHLLVHEHGKACVHRARPPDGLVHVLALHVRLPLSTLHDITEQRWYILLPPPGCQKDQPSCSTTSTAHSSGPSTS